MERRAVGIYAAVVLLFTGVLCRLYALSLGETLASAATTQSSYLLEVDDTRGLLYDCNLKPLVGAGTHPVAAVQPSPEANAALAEVVNEYGEALAFDPEARRPYLVELGEHEVYAKNVELFDAVDRYAEGQLAPHLVGYLTPEGDHGAAGLELAYDELLRQYGGSLAVRYTLDLSLIHI